MDRGPAAVPVEMPYQLLHLGQAEVGDDHPFAAGQVLLAVGECTEIPQFLNCCSYDVSKGAKNLPAATCAAVKVQRQELRKKPVQPAHVLAAA